MGESLWQQEHLNQSALATIALDEHLLLRPFEPEDAATLFAAVNRSRQHLAPWLSWVSGTTKLEHSLDFVHKMRVQLHNQEGLALGIFCDGEVIGGVGMHNRDHAANRADIGYWICAEYEGKGIVRRSVTALVDYLFTKVGLNKIEIRYITANKRSAIVAERLGFRIEGIIRKSFMNNGIAEDLVVAGLLKHEWQQSRKEN